MRVLCKISGLEFFSSDHFKTDSKLIDYHPIFKLPVRTLLSRAKKYGEMKYSDEEETLLFLALLNSTNAITWNIQAQPTVPTVKKHLESVFKLVSWYSSIDSSVVKFPNYRVTENNYTLDNIGIFITSLYEIRNEWRSPASRKLLQDVLEDREFRLNKLIHSSHRNPTTYASILASWAMDAAEVKNTKEYPDKREVWISLFKLNPDKDLFSADLDELLDLQDHMQKCLYSVGSVGNGAGTQYSAEVLTHLHNLVEMRKGGMLTYLGGYDAIPSNTFSVLPETSYTSYTTENLKDREQELVKQLQDAGAPLTLPIATAPEYIGKLSTYVRARAAWVVTTKLREELEYVRNKI
jgi:hypothetical protein